MSPLASQLLLWAALVLVFLAGLAYEVWRTKRQRFINEQWRADALAWYAGQASDLRITENSTWRAYGCEHDKTRGLACTDCREHYAHDDEGEAWGPGGDAA